MSHVENAPADLQLLAGDDAAERARQIRHHAQIAEAPAQQQFGVGLAQAMRVIEAAIGLGIQRAGIEPNAQSVEIFGLAGVKRQIEALGRASRRGRYGRGGNASRGCASASCRAAGPAKKTLPELARHRVVDPGVDKRKAVAVLDEIDVDVIEPERQRQPQPKDARRRLDHFQRLRRVGKGEVERGSSHGGGVSKKEFASRYSTNARGPHLRLWGRAERPMSKLAPEDIGPASAKCAPNPADLKFARPAFPPARFHPILPPWPNPQNPRARKPPGPRSIRSASTSPRC